MVPNLFLNLTLAVRADPTLKWVAAAVLLVVGLVLLRQARSALQSLRQAALLGNVVALARLSDHEGQVVCVSGEPRTEAEFLWLSLDHQVYVHDREHRGRERWLSEGQELVTPSFTLHDKEGSVKVRNRPTEVHGSESDVIHGRHATHRQSSKVALSGGADDGKRTLREVLPLTDRLVACGRLRRSKDTGELLLDRDPSVGMLLSTRSPESQALRERLKGALWLGVGPALWLAGALASWSLLF